MASRAAPPPALAAPVGGASSSLNSSLSSSSAGLSPPAPAALGERKGTPLAQSAIEEALGLHSVNLKLEGEGGFPSDGAGGGPGGSRCVELIWLGELK